MHRTDPLEELEVTVARDDEVLVVRLARWLTAQADEEGVARRGEFRAKVDAARWASVDRVAQHF